MYITKKKKSKLPTCSLEGNGSSYYGGHIHYGTFCLTECCNVGKKFIYQNQNQKLLSLTVCFGVKDYKG